MTASHSDEGAAESRQPDEDKVQYPTNHVLAVLDTAEQTGCAIDGLVHGGVDPQTRIDWRAEPAVPASWIGLSG